MDTATELLYWKDTYLCEESSHVISVQDGDKGNKIVTLRSTIFHPQGGDLKS